MRPLLRSTFSEDDEYVELGYDYNLESINNMKSYLPKSVKFMGVDI